MQSLGSFQALLLQDFEPYCSTFRQDVLYSDVIERIYEINKDEQTTYGEAILKRCALAKSAEYREFILENFSFLPLGPRLKLIGLIELNLVELVYSYEEEIRSSSTNRSNFWNNNLNLSHIIKARHFLNPIEIFSNINYLLKENLLSISEYQQALNYLLYDQGFMSKDSTIISIDHSEFKPFSPNQKAIRVRKERHLFYDAIITPYPLLDPENNCIGVEFMTLDQQFCQATFDSPDIICHSIEAFPASSSLKAFWKFSPLLRNIHVNFQDLNRVTSVKPDFVPVLEIGGIIEFERAHLEIIQVQCFDAHSTFPTCMKFVLVVQGRWGKLLRNEELTDADELLLNEGKTELGDSNEIDESPNSANNEHNSQPQIIPDYSLPGQYFLLYGDIHGDICSIGTLVALENTLFPDQIPVGVKLVSSTSGFIYGTNALLASFSLNDQPYSVPHYWSTRESMSTSSFDFHYSLTASLLVKDNLIFDESQLKNSTISTTHAFDSSIINIDFSPNSQRLISIDNSGTIVLWCLNNFQYQMVGNPFSIPARYVLKNAVFGPSGDHLFLFIKDCLLLMKINVSTNNSPLNYECIPVLEQKSFLDLQLEGNLCHYCVHSPNHRLKTDQQEKEEIFQLVRLSAQMKSSMYSTAMILTMWQHQNIDSFPSKVQSYSAFSAPQLSSPSLPASSSQHFCHRKEVSSSETDQSVTFLTDIPSHATIFKETEIRNDANHGIGNISPNQVDSEDLNENLNFMIYENEIVPIFPAIVSLNMSLLDASSQMALSNDQQNSFSESPKESVVFNSTPFQLHDNNVTNNDDVIPENAKFLMNWLKYSYFMRKTFHHDRSELFLKWKRLFAILAAFFQSPSLQLVSTILEISLIELENFLSIELKEICLIVPNYPNTTATATTTPMHRNSYLIILKDEYKGFFKWLTNNTIPYRIGQEFWIDISLGHNLLTAFYLKHFGNKSVAIENTWCNYLQVYGSSHLRKSSRGLKLLTTMIRKIDETANIKHFLPHQIGYVSGLQEIYARRVGLSGKLPNTLGELKYLRVLSMGNNSLTGELPQSLGNLKLLQRIVLHQNNLIGNVPNSLDSLGCIVNLAGNPRLKHGNDVPLVERQALIDIFVQTNGYKWITKTNWNTQKPICKWYKVGVLSSHVHSLVMSSNGMEGSLPSSIQYLSHLRMIELATMPLLTGYLPKELCSLIYLKRLCICRCNLIGSIPMEIGLLINLEELQLFGNNFTGIIPITLGNLSNLKLLSLGEYTGGNRFDPNPIPFCISKLFALEALFLANCNLIGSLPNWIGNLKELRQLDLQKNQLSGIIPSTIGQLSNLLYLNVKDNYLLGGKLPLLEILSLTKLNRLSLVHCSFEDTEMIIEAIKLSLPRCKVWV